MGRVIREVQRDEVVAILDVFQKQGVEAIAVCLEHSDVNPAHEIEIGAIIAELRPDADVSLSHQVAREFREYARMSATVLDACTRRITVGYLTSLEDRLREIGFDGRLYLVSPSGILGVNAIKEKTIAAFAAGPLAGCPEQPISPRPSRCPIW